MTGVPNLSGRSPLPPGAKNRTPTKLRHKPFTPMGLAQTIYRQRPILTSMDTR